MLSLLGAAPGSSRSLVALDPAQRIPQRLRTLAMLQGDGTAQDSVCAAWTSHSGLGPPPAPVTLDISSTVSCWNIRLSATGSKPASI
jgi:hypothetical protein